jgi:hypothetical protein
MDDYNLTAGSCPHCGVTQQPSSTRDFCSYFPPSLPCLPPEPFASMIDVLTAAQKVEDAIHAEDKSETEKYLKEAKAFLQYAHAYLETYHSPEAETVTKVINQLNELISETSNIPSVKLGTFQQQELYAFQGVLSSLYSGVSSL